MKLSYIASDLRALAHPIAELVLDPENERIHDERNRQVVRSSLERFGQVKPVVVHERNGELVVIAGNCTVEETRALGREFVAVTRFEHVLDEARAYRVGDNRSSDLSYFDDEPLYEALAELRDIDPDLFAATGFDELDLDALCKSLEPTGGDDSNEPGSDHDKVPYVVKPRTKLGQRIRIGLHVLECGDCLDMLKRLRDNSIDACVTDPPYGIGFMGRAWDCATPGDEWARELFRVLKPGAHVIAFGATRTVHRIAVVLEDAGFEVRDQIGWATWQGMPKSLDVSKALDELAGVKRRSKRTSRTALTEPASKLAREWSGFGTALKPVIEPAILVRKPLDGTLAKNLERWGTGAINVDGCRFADGDPAWVGPSTELVSRTTKPSSWFATAGVCEPHKLGRWPANLYYCPKASSGERKTGLDDIETVSLQLSPLGKEGESWENEVRKVTLQVDTVTSRPRVIGVSMTGKKNVTEWNTFLFGRAGTARFQKGTVFTTSTATDSTTEFKTLNWLISSLTSESIAGVNYEKTGGGNRVGSAANCYISIITTLTGSGLIPGVSDALSKTPWRISVKGAQGSAHPTVKPVALIRWLVRLVTPPGGVVLDTFVGSGTTLVAAELEGVTCRAAEFEPYYCDIARARLEYTRRTR